tara:strand:- start:5115 stop:5549 length:435 start_codon:yes stop_codon:yes gene_type:complete
LIGIIPDWKARGRRPMRPAWAARLSTLLSRLGRLVSGVSPLGGVSRDNSGQMLTRALTGSNVGTDLLVRSGGQSTLAVVDLVNGSATNVVQNENSAGGLVAVQDASPLSREVKALCFGALVWWPSQAGGATQRYWRVNVPATVS